MENSASDFLDYYCPEHATWPTQGSPLGPFLQMRCMECERFSFQRSAQPFRRLPDGAHICGACDGSERTHPPFTPPPTIPGGSPDQEGNRNGIDFRPNHGVVHASQLPPVIRTVEAWFQARGLTGPESLSETVYGLQSAEDSPPPENPDLCFQDIVLPKDGYGIPQYRSETLEDPPIVQRTVCGKHLRPPLLSQIPIYLMDGDQQRDIMTATLTSLVDEVGQMIQDRVVRPESNAVEMERAWKAQTWSRCATRVRCRFWAVVFRSMSSSFFFSFLLFRLCRID